MALTPKQRRFVEEYLVDLNGTQAAIRAGYSPKTANEQAARLLANVSVAAAVAEAKEARSMRARVTADAVLQEIARIAFADLRKVAEWTSYTVKLRPSDELDDDAAAAISEVGMTENGPKVKLHDKLGALRDLAKHLGLTPERHEVSGPEGGPIEVSDAHAKLADLVARSARAPTAGGDRQPES